MGNPLVMKFEVNDAGSVKIQTINRNVDGLNHRISASERTTRLFSKSLAVMGAGMSNIIALTAAAAAVTGTFAAAIASVQIKRIIGDATAYETKLADLVKVTDESLTTLNKKVLGISPAMGKPTEIAEGYYMALSAGLDPLRDLEAAQKTAKAAHVEQGIVIDGVSKMMAGYAKETMTAAKATDLMFGIEAKGITKVRELIPYIGGLSAMAAEAKVHSEEMAAAFATVTKLSGDTAEAATGVRAMFVELLRSGDGLSKAMKDIGYSSGEATDALGDIGLVGTLKKVMELVDEGKYKIGDLFVGVQAANAVRYLVNRDFATVEDALKRMTTATGLAENAWKAYADTTAAKSEEVGNRISRLRTIIGQNWDPIIKGILEATDAWIQRNEKIIIQYADIELARLRLTKAILWAEDMANQGKIYAGTPIKSLLNDLNLGGSVVGATFASMYADVMKTLEPAVNYVIDSYNSLRDGAVGVANIVEASMKTIVGAIRDRAAEIYNEILSWLKLVQSIPVVGNQIFPGMIGTTVSALPKLGTSAGKSFMENLAAATASTNLDNMLPRMEHYKAPELIGLTDEIDRLVDEWRAAHEEIWTSGADALETEEWLHARRMEMLDAEIQKRIEFLTTRLDLNEQEKGIDADRVQTQIDLNDALAKKAVENASLTMESLKTAQAVAEATGKKGSQVARGLSAAVTLFSAYEAAQQTYTRIIEAPGAGPGAIVTAQIMAALTLAQGLARVAMIQSAPTYHTGGLVTAGGPREVPIIAQEGEIILNREQVAMLSRARQAEAAPISIAVFDDREALNSWAESRDGRVRIVRASRAYERERRL